ncbi:LOG family protein YvdD [bacterium BMS3Abin03]|nr:LOG family protein YvdD [bacterium BMS3Abin03]
MRKTITVFGSSRPTEGEEEYKTAYELGFKLAGNNFNVCTGGYLGTMEAVSKGAAEAGGEATGVTIKSWGKAGNRFLTHEIECNSLCERLNKLIELGDAYIVLQGGTGTLLELAAVWEFSNRGMIDHKPVVCHSLMWKEIVRVINKQMEYEGRSTNLVKSLETVEEIVNYLKTSLK